MVWDIWIAKNMNKRYYGLSLKNYLTKLTSNVFSKVRFTWFILDIWALLFIFFLFQKKILLIAVSLFVYIIAILIDPRIDTSKILLSI